MKITPIDYVLFAVQVLVQLTIKLVTAIIGLPIVAVGLFFIRKPEDHEFYDFVETGHATRHIDRGASGHWEYWQLPDWKIMKPYSNLNYGLLGEPTGRWSALRDGKERTYASMFRQAAVRNPANGLRYVDFTSCQVDNCDIIYKGDFGPLDIQPKLVPGCNFTKGVDKTSGRKYYSFQYVTAMGKDHGFRIRAGFKIEPSHSTRGDLEPSKERSTFTMRFNPYKAIDAFEK